MRYGGITLRPELPRIPTNAPESIKIQLRCLRIHYEHAVSKNALRNCNFAVFSTGSIYQVYRVTDEALIAETTVWPNFFLMNIFFALKGFKLFIIICCHCSWMLCHMAAVKSLPALIYSADYILHLVLRDHGIYSESSKLIIRFDSFSE